MSYIHYRNLIPRFSLAWFTLVAIRKCNKLMGSSFMARAVQYRQMSTTKQSSDVAYPSRQVKSRTWMEGFTNRSTLAAIVREEKPDTVVALLFDPTQGMLAHAVHTNTYIVVCSHHRVWLVCHATTVMLTLHALSTTISGAVSLACAPFLCSLRYINLSVHSQLTSHVL